MPKPLCDLRALHRVYSEHAKTSDPTISDCKLVSCVLTADICFKSDPLQLCSLISSLEKEKWEKPASHPQLFLSPVTRPSFEQELDHLSQSLATVILGWDYEMVQPTKLYHCQSSGHFVTSQFWNCKLEKNIPLVNEMDVISCPSPLIPQLS